MVTENLEPPNRMRVDVKTKVRPIYKIKDGQTYIFGGINMRSFVTFSCESSKNRTRHKDLVPIMTDDVRAGALASTIRRLLI
jgi:outer membrane protein assembly factor BamA